MNTIEFKNLILELSTKIRPWLAVFPAASFVFLINSVTNLNVIIPYLSAKLNFNTSEIGMLFACYYYSNILFVFWAGTILDNFSAKKILVMSFIITNFCILAFALTKSLFLMAILRLLLGIVGSFSMLNCFQLIKRWFPTKKATFVTGIVTTYAAFGTLFSQTPLMLAIEKFGWQSGLLINLWLGIVFCVLAIIFTHDFPLNAKQNDNKIIIKQTSIWRIIKEITTNYQNLIIGIYALLMTLPRLFFGASWSMLYLQEEKHLTNLDSSYIISSYIIGTIIGSSLAGLLSYKFNIRKLPLIVGTFFVFIILLVVTKITTLSFLVFVVLFFIFGIMSSSQITIYPLVAENNPPSLLSTAIGFVATLIALGGICIQLLVRLMDCWKIDSSTSNYFSVMLALIGIIIFNIFLVCFIKEKPHNNKIKPTY